VLRVLVAHCLCAGLAIAAPPRDLARARTALLGGRITLQLADGMVARADGTGADLDWGDARFSLTLTEHRDARDPASRIAGQVARVERIVVGKSWTAVLIQPRMPRRTGGRAVLVAVYLVDTVGSGVDLEVTISDAGFDDAAAWSALARRSIATLTATSEVVVASPPPPGGPPPARIGDAKDFCEIHDNEVDVHSVGRTISKRIIDGNLRGREVYWFEWDDKAGSHREAITGAARWGILHVVCHAPTAKRLAVLRRTLEARLSAGDGSTPPPAGAP